MPSICHKAALPHPAGTEDILMPPVRPRHFLSGKQPTQNRTRGHVTVPLCVGYRFPDKGYSTTSPRYGIGAGATTGFGLEAGGQIL